MCISGHISNKLKSKQKEPWWKRRLEKQVKEMNQDLGRINTLLEKKPIKKKHSERLQRKYNMKMKGLKVVREEIKQRIKAKVGKITRYQNRLSQYQQNRMFNNNEGRFYQRLNKEVHKKIKYLMPVKRKAIGKVYGARVESIIEEQSGLRTFKIH